MSQSSLPVAILVAPGFAETQFTDTQKALLAAGIAIAVATPDSGLVQGWHEEAWGHHFMADIDLADALSADYAGLILPGGTRNVAALGESAHAKRLIKAFVDTGKPLLAIGEAAGLLLAAEVVAGRRLSAAETWHEPLTAAGGTLAGEALARDGNIVTLADGDGLAGALVEFQGLLASDVPDTREAA